MSRYFTIYFNDLNEETQERLVMSMGETIIDELETEVRQAEGKPPADEWYKQCCKLYSLEVYKDTYGGTAHSHAVIEFATELALERLQKAFNLTEIEVV